MSYVSYGDYIAQRPLNQSMVMKEDFIPKATKNCQGYLARQTNETFQLPADSSSQEESISQGGSSDPKEWGPKYWYSLHNSAAHYPINASPLVRERMKARILAIPYEIACPTCQPHASAYIEGNAHRLDEIVSGREQLSKFYVDFHNKVNKRLGKPEWTHEQAVKHYSK